MTPSVRLTNRPEIEEAVIKHELHIDARRPIVHARRSWARKRRILLAGQVQLMHDERNMTFEVIARELGYTAAYVCRAYHWSERPI